MNIDDFIADIITEELQRTGKQIVRSLQGELKRKDKVASGNLVESISFSLSGQQITISMPRYAEYVDKGRKPGSFPPPNKIKEWIRVKNISPRGLSGSLRTQQNSLAYLIGRKIEEKGIEPTNFIDNANIDDQLQDLQNRIANKIERELPQYIEDNL